MLTTAPADVDVDDNDSGGGGFLFAGLAGFREFVHSSAGLGRRINTWPPKFRSWAASSTNTDFCRAGLRARIRTRPACNPAWFSPLSLGLKEYAFN
jgi:hypothetical protein